MSKCVSDEGVERVLTCQVCEVSKGLLSVKKLTAAGHRVVMDENVAFIEDKTTGEKIWLEEVGGMYALRLWVPTGFQGQGTRQ